MNTTIFSIEDYYPPQWSAPPMHSCLYNIGQLSFEIIKEGCLLGKIIIKHKDFNLIGRLDDLCDIPIDNMTVSRKHAILQFKKEDDYGYLYDLGGTHGTEVNKQKLPAHTYHKLMPFDNIKFGVSSRIYIFRCTALEQKIEQAENQKENKFKEMIEQQNRVQSKEEIKQKYLKMLAENPYTVPSASRDLVGKQQELQEDRIDGIDWGISNQRNVYNYTNENEFPIDADLLRRLNLDQVQLNKLAEYENNLRKYQQIEVELNQLTNKEQREYGLEEKLQNKKDKLQRKFVQGLQALQKSEQWLRVNIFGDKGAQQGAKMLLRLQDNDTFGDDDYLDRTLEKKNVIIKENALEMVTTEDYWQLQKQLKQCQRLKDELEKLHKETEKQMIDQKNEIGQDDELEEYMKVNNVNLSEQQARRYEKQLKQFDEQISTLKVKIANIVGEKGVGEIMRGGEKGGNLNELYEIRMRQEQEAKNMIKKQNNESIEEVLKRLQGQQQKQDEVDELNINIFKAYQPAQAEEDDEYLKSRQRYEQRIQPEGDSLNKYAPAVTKYPKRNEQVNRDVFANQEDCFEDLTKFN